MPEERIEGPAIRLPDGFLIATGPGTSHAEAAIHLWDTGLLPPKIAKGHYGFLTSSARFVGREEAYNIAAAAGQLKHRADTIDGILFPEDLW